MTGMLQGNLALVTGASSGIGRATCQVLAREGTTIVVTCIVEEGARETLASLPAEVDMGDNNNEFMQMIFKQIEMLGNKYKNDSKALSKDHAQLATALLQVAPVITIKGNITDPASRLTVTFTVHASRDTQHHSLADLAERRVPDYDDDEVDEDKEMVDWRGSGGVLSPIVGLMEPYLLGLAELVFNGILSSIVTNFLEGATLCGDVRLV